MVEWTVIQAVRVYGFHETGTNLRLYTFYLQHCDKNTFMPATIFLYISNQRLSHYYFCCRIFFPFNFKNGPFSVLYSGKKRFDQISQNFGYILFKLRFSLYFKHIAPSDNISWWYFIEIKLIKNNKKINWLRATFRSKSTKKYNFIKMFIIFSIVIQQYKIIFWVYSQSIFFQFRALWLDFSFIESSQTTFRWSKKKPARSLSIIGNSFEYLVHFKIFTF